MLMQRVALGVLGGVSGLLAMRLMRRTTNDLLRPLHELEERDVRRLRPRGHAARREKAWRIIRNPEDSASTVLGARAFQLVTGRRPSKVQKRLLDHAVHWSFGLAMGGAYGGLHSAEPVGSTLARGALFGLALWAVGDEGLVPFLGLSAKPSDYLPSAHLLTLAGHVAYGTATAVAVWALEGAPSASAARASAA